MKLVPGKDFWQASIGQRYVDITKLENKAGGVCLRVACKWLLCKIYDRDFLTYDAKLTGRTRWQQGHGPEFGLTGWKRADFNPVNTINKQMDYLKKMAPFEKPNTSYSTFLSGVQTVSKEQIESWGNKIGKYAVTAVCHTYMFLENQEKLKKDGMFIVGIAGTSDPPLTRHYIPSETAGAPWAHAFAFYRNGAQVRFFDSNGGEYQIEGNEDPGTAIEKHARKFYIGYEKVYGFNETEVDGAKQFERDLSKTLDRKFEDGYKSIKNYLLFEVTKK